MISINYKSITQFVWENTGQCDIITTKTGMSKAFSFKTKSKNKETIHKWHVFSPPLASSAESELGIAQPQLVSYLFSYIHISCCLFNVQVCNELGCLILVAICNTLVIFGLKLTKPHLFIPWLGVYLLGTNKKWKTTSIFLENRRQPQSLANGRLPIIF